jgi:hypothetical protein
MAKYRNILLDMQNTSSRIDEAGLPSAEMLPSLYDGREDGEEECFFSEEFEAPSDELAVKVSWGIFWDNNFTKMDACTTVQRWDGSAWVEIGEKTNMELCDQCGEEYEKIDTDGGRCLNCGTMIVADKNSNIMWISKEKAREMILEAYALVRDMDAKLFLHIDCDNDLEVIEVGVENSEYKLIFPNNKVKYDSKNGFLLLKEEANVELVKYQVLGIMDLTGQVIR